MREFVFIGPGKTGSTWLRQALINTDISLSTGIKETNYYSTGYHHGRDWYLSFFDNEKFLDIGNTYIYDDLALSRIVSNDVAVVVAYRSIKDRLISMYNFDLRSGLIKESVSIDEYLKLDWVRSKVFIYDNIKYLCDSGVRIHVWNYEKFKKDNQSELASLTNFLNVDRIIHEDLPTSRINEASRLRFSFLGVLSRSIASFLREHEFYGILNWFKSSPVARKLLFRSVKVRINVSIPTDILEEDLRIRKLLNV